MRTILLSALMAFTHSLIRLNSNKMQPKNLKAHIQAEAKAGLPGSVC